MPTDKERLDWLTKALNYPVEGIEIQCTGDGLEIWDGNDWHINKSPRIAIDSAMRSQHKRNKN